MGDCSFRNVQLNSISKQGVATTNTTTEVMIMKLHQHGTCFPFNIMRHNSRTFSNLCLTNVY